MQTSIKKLLLPLLFCCIFTFSCHKSDNPFDYTLNLETLWKIIDEKYCYLEAKNIDWDSIHKFYSRRVHSINSQEGLFNICNQMLLNLEDAHVNLYSGFDMGKSWKWYEGYAPNFSSEVLYSHYLKEDYCNMGSVLYTRIGPRNDIGYIYYPTFSYGIGQSQISYLFSYFRQCRGLIIDVRNNGGGQLLYAQELACRFCKKAFGYSFIQHKTGPGHQEFSSPMPLTLYPCPPELYWDKPVIVLCNRRCYSTTNDFVNIMKQLPTVKVVGDITGGGGGLPFTEELPNGWMVRYSASPSFNAQMEHLEFGVLPHVRMDLDTMELKKGKDSYIEYAIESIYESAATPQ